MRLFASQLISFAWGMAAGWLVTYLSLTYERRTVQRVRKAVDELASFHDLTEAQSHRLNYEDWATDKVVWRQGDRTIPNFDGKLSFDAMRKKCRAVGDQIEVGHWDGEAGLLSLIEAEKKKKQWKWRDPKTNKGVIAPENWLSGKRWLDIVES